METFNTKSQVPLRMVLYGTDGIGKSTLCATSFPRPVFLDCEDGLRNIDAVSLSKAPITDARTAWGHVLELQGDHGEFQTLVIDSIDWFEKLLHKQLCEQHSAESLSDESCKQFSFGRGYLLARDLLAKFLSVLSRFREIGMHVILISHAAVIRTDPPGGESYDRYDLAIDKRAAGLVREWADEVLFMRYKTFTRSEDQGFGRERQIAMGTGQRIICAHERPAWAAKTRLGFPAEFEPTVDFLTTNGKAI